jgi:hypothetical protein
MSSEIELIIMNHLKKPIDDITFKKVLEIGGQTYALLEKEKAISITRVIRDPQGNLGFEDIENDAEYDYVKSYYIERQKAGS